MAIDSEQKRRSIVSVARRFQPKRLKPDGTIDANDRRFIGWNYAGLSAVAVDNLKKAVMWFIK